MRSVADLKTDLILASMLHHFVVDNLVHHLKPLDGFLLGDADVLLLQWDGTERVVKEVETAVHIHTQEPRNITVVRQRCRQSDQSHILLCCLNVTYCPIRNDQC